MVLFTGNFIALVLFSLTAYLPLQLCISAKQPCHFVLNNSDFGVVRPTVEELAFNVCSWSISASPERRFVINVESVYLFDENASLTIMVDGNKTIYSNISCNEWERQQLTGKTLQIVYRLPSAKKEYGKDPRNFTLSSSPVKLENSTALPQECNATQFEIRYKSFNPLECEAPVSPVNGFTVAGKTRRIGEKVKYQCHPPSLLEKGSLSTTTCVLNLKVLPLPSWSNPPPNCILPECSKMPVKIPLDSSQNKTTLKLENLKFSKLKNCMWEITSERNKYLVVQVEHLSLPQHSTTGGKQQMGATLELYDDRISEGRLLARYSGAVDSSKTNYTTAFSKLIVSLRIGNLFTYVQPPQSDISNEMDDEIRHYGFTLSVSAKIPLCQFPKGPVHGDVKGVRQSTDGNPEPSQGIIFYCNSGFYLNGSVNASCLGNGQWSEHVPTCVASDVLSDDLDSYSFELPTTAMGSETNLSETTEETVQSGKTQQSRLLKDRKPHPQSTEEKTNMKAIKDDSIMKHTFLNPHATQALEILANFTDDLFPEDDQSSSGKVFLDLPSNLDEFDDAFSNYGNVDDRGESEGEDFAEDDVVRDNGTDSSEFPVIAIILGVGIPLILGIVAVAVFFVYRKLYPVRMNLGRKFETFENPAYGRGKRDPGTPLSGTLLPDASLAQSPAELQRLTRQTLP